MAPRTHPSYPQLATFLTKLSLPPQNLSKSHSVPSEDTKDDIIMSESCEDGPPDEGFHEEWPPFGPSDLMQFMTYKQCMNFIKEWSEYLPPYCLSEIAKHISPRLHRDIIRDLPQELQYEILSYLDVADLANALRVSSTWYQICSYPPLWRTSYFKEGWTIAEEVMLDFESRLLRLQAKLDSQYIRLQQLPFLDIYETCRPCSPTTSSSDMESMDNDSDEARDVPSSELNHYYSIFFSSIIGAPSSSTNLTRLSRTRAQFNTITRVEIGEPFHNAATFTQEINGSVRAHVDWHYLYANRSLLESNWRSGCYQATQLDGAPDIVQPNQREGIYCVVFDRNLLAAGSRDNSIRLWSMEDLCYRGKLEAHEGSVLCLQLDSKRGFLVSGSSDSTIKIWDLHIGKVIQTLQGHSESVLGLHLADKYLVSCSRDNTARIWELHETPNSEEKDLIDTSHSQAEGQRSQLHIRFISLHILRGHRAAVNSVHVRNEIIATASGDRTVKLWNLTSGTMIRTIGAHARGIACVSLTNKVVVTGSSDHVIKIFDLESGENIRILRGHNGLVRTIQTDNTKIISGSYDQSIRIWDLKSGDMLQELNNCHDSKIFRVHRDQRRIVSCCGNAKIVIWDFTRRPQSDGRSAGGRLATIDAAFF